MTVSIINGDMFKSDVQCLVNPVNCFGVMGKGLALVFKNAFPGNFVSYAAYCKQRRLTPGRAFVHSLNTPKGNLKYIANVATKNHWSDKSSLAVIEKCAESIKDLIGDYRLNSISIPALGCGLGELEWDKVSIVLRQTLRNVPCRINIYRPQ